MSGQEIECVLCRKKKHFEMWASGGREIEAWSKVCRSCRELWELGRRTMSATKSDGKETEIYVHSDVPTSPTVGDAQGPTEVKGKDIMLALGGVNVRGTGVGGKHGFSRSDKRINIVESQDERDCDYIGGANLQFKAQTSRAEAMKRVVAGFLNAIAKARVEGFNEGRNLLTGLARGEVSMEKFSEQCDNARVGKKPRTRWD